jgi:hypothetical protein
MILYITRKKESGNYLKLNYIIELQKTLYLKGGFYNEEKFEKVTNLYDHC